MSAVRLKVKCYEGHKTAERPVEFELGEEVLAVLAVLDRWYEPDCTYFKVKASDGNVYILKNRLSNGWTLESFRRESNQQVPKKV